MTYRQAIIKNVLKVVANDVAEKAREELKAKGTKILEDKYKAFRKEAN